MWGRFVVNRQYKMTMDVMLKLEDVLATMKASDMLVDWASKLNHELASRSRQLKIDKPTDGVLITSVYDCTYSITYRFGATGYSDKKAKQMMCYYIYNKLPAIATRVDVRDMRILELEQQLYVANQTIVKMTNVIHDIQAAIGMLGSGNSKGDGPKVIKSDDKNYSSQTSWAEWATIAKFMIAGFIADDRDESLVSDRYLNIGEVDMEEMFLVADKVKYGSAKGIKLGGNRTFGNVRMQNAVVLSLFHGVPYEAVLLVMSIPNESVRACVYVYRKGKDA